METRREERIGQLLQELKRSDKLHLGVALAYAHNSAAAHTLHGKVHNEQQEQERKCIAQYL